MAMASSVNSDVTKKLNRFSMKFRGLWLDEDVDNGDNLKREHSLKEIFPSIETFATIEKFTEWFDQENENPSLKLKKKFILILSNQYAKKIVPKIQETYPRIVAIYIDSHNNHQSRCQLEKWGKKYDKVNCLIDISRTFFFIQIRSVELSFDEIIDELSNDQSDLYQEKEGPVLTVFYDENITTPDRSTTPLNGEFLCIQLFIEVLLRMRHRDDLESFINYLKVGFGNCRETEISNFETTYKAEDAIIWYTKESFVYRMLNKALRTFDIETLVRYRFFIKDLADELKKRQLDSIPQQIYRGQLMSSEELDQIKSAVGHSVAFNSFLSTTRKRDIAQGFLDRSLAHAETAAREAAKHGKTVEPLQKILFTINIPEVLNNVKPFVDIGRLRQKGRDVPTSDITDKDKPINPVDKEILFMLGSVFKVEKVIRDEKNDVWKVILRLCNGDDWESKRLLEYTKTIIEAKTYWCDLGNLLCDMGKLDEGILCYEKQIAKPEGDEIANQFYQNTSSR